MPCFSIFIVPFLTHLFVTCMCQVWPRSHWSPPPFGKHDSLSLLIPLPSTGKVVPNPNSLHVTAQECMSKCDPTCQGAGSAAMCQRFGDIFMCCSCCSLLLCLLNSYTFQSLSLSIAVLLDPAEICRSVQAVGLLSWTAGEGPIDACKCAEMCSQHKDCAVLLPAHHALLYSLEFELVQAAVIACYAYKALKITCSNLCFTVSVL